MTSKRTINSEAVSPAGNSSARRPRRAGATHKPAASVESTLGPATVDEEAIARLAYSYWEARGYAHGAAEDDWFRAERELLNG